MIGLNEPPTDSWVKALSSKLEASDSSAPGTSPLPSSDSRNSYDLLESEAPVLVRRVFISSTFRDFHSERDLLQKKVAPRLRLACAAHGEQLDLVDLRWGVDTSSMSEEEASKKVVKRCFDLIDSCKPYFVCFVGERYGWIPGEAAWKGALDARRAEILSSEARPLGGVSELSVTAAEILYGVFQITRCENKGHVIACLRDPIDLAKHATSEDGYASEGHCDKLETIRALLERECGDGLIRYEATLNEGSGALENMVTASGEPLDRSLEEAILGAFQDDWNREGQRGEFDRLLASNRKFVSYRVEAPYSLKRDELLEKAAEAIDLRIDPVCIVGDRGEGKTQLLCELLHRYSSMPRTKSIGYFPDASVSGRSLSAVFDYLLTCIRTSLGLSPVSKDLPREAADAEPFDHRTWSALINGAISEYGKSSGEVVRLFVAVDTSDGPAGLTDAAAKVFSSIHRFSRLKRSENPFVLFRAVISEDRSNLAKGGGGYAEFSIAPLSQGEYLELAELKLWESHRDVTPRMRAALAGMGTNKTPLHAVLSTNLLALLGGRDLSSLESSQQIDRRISDAIAAMPDDVARLGVALIDGVCSSPDASFLRTAVEALAFLPYGTTVQTLESICEKAENRWRTLEFEIMLGSLSPLIVRGADGLIKITHASFRRALENRVLNHGEESQKDFFALLVNRMLSTTDGSRASLGNVFYLCRMLDLPNLALALCHLAVSHSGKAGLLPPANVRNALMDELVLDEKEWIADAVRRTSRDGRISPSAVSFLLWAINTCQRTRGSDAALCNLGFESIAAYNLMIKQGVDMSFCEKAKNRASHRTKTASMRSDPLRWSGIIEPPDVDKVKSGALLRQGVMVSYIGETYKWAKYEVEGKVAYDLDILSDWNPNAAEVHLVGFGDSGLTHILANGYPYRSVKGNGQQDQFITQAALWWYLSEKGCGSIGTQFTESEPDPYNLRPFIRALVDSACATQENGSEPWFDFCGKRLRPCVFSTDRWNSSMIIVLLDVNELPDTDSFEMPVAKIPPELCSRPSDGIVDVTEQEREGQDGKATRTISGRKITRDSIG
ncbi:DUF4062 domain-containing protein [Thermophilibacter sp. ZX-H3]